MPEKTSRLGQKAFAWPCVPRSPAAQWSAVLIPVLRRVWVARRPMRDELLGLHGVLRGVLSHVLRHGLEPHRHSVRPL